MKLNSAYSDAYFEHLRKYGRKSKLKKTLLTIVVSIGLFLICIMLIKDIFTIVENNYNLAAVFITDPGMVARSWLYGVVGLAGILILRLEIRVRGKPYTILNLADAAFEQGDICSVEKLLDNYLEKCRRIHDNGSIEFAGDMYSLAYWLFSHEDYGQGEQFYDEYKKILKDILHNEKNRAYLLALLASLEVDNTDSVIPSDTKKKNLEEYAILAEELYGKVSWECGIISQYLGWFYMGEGAYEEAETHLKKALELFSENKSDMDNLISKCYVLRDLGTISYNLQRFSDSASFLLQAQKTYAEYLNSRQLSLRTFYSQRYGRYAIEDIEFEFHCMYGLGLCAMSEGDYEKAKSFLTHAFDTAKKRRKKIMMNAFFRYALDEISAIGKTLDNDVDQINQLLKEAKSRSKKLKIT